MDKALTCLGRACVVRDVMAYAAAPRTGYRR